MSTMTTTAAVRTSSPTRGLPEQRRLDAERAERQDFTTALGAAVDLEWATTALDRLLGQAEYGPTPGFRLSEEQYQRLSAGLPDHLADFGDALSLPHAQAMREQRLIQAQHEQRLGEQGWTGTAMRIGAAIVDPIDVGAGIVVGAATGGTGAVAMVAGKATRLGRMARVGLIGSASAVPAQVLISAADPAQDWHDVLWAASGGALGAVGIDEIGRGWSRAWRGVQREMDAGAVYAAGAAANPAAVAQGPRAVFDGILTDQGRLVFRDTLSPDAQRAAGQQLIDSLDVDDDVRAALRAELETDPDVMLQRFTRDPYGTLELREQPLAADAAELPVAGAEPRRARIAGDFHLPERLSDEMAARHGRLPTYSALTGNSASPTARALGAAMVDDSVTLRARPQLDTASAWSRRTHDGIMGRYRKEKDQAYRTWLGATGTTASARARDAFEREVGAAFHHLGTPRASAPGIAEAIKAHQELTRSVAGIAGRHGVPAFENLIPDDSYFSRVYSPARLTHADNKHTRAEVERLFATAFRRENPNAPDNVAQAVGRNMPRILADLRTRTEFGIVSAIRGLDRDELARLLRDIEVPEDVADEILGSVKPRPDGTTPPMGRRRTLLDEQTVIDTPQGALSFTDLLELNADKIAARYTSTLVGHSAMATTYRALSRTLGVEVRRFEDVVPVIERELAEAGMPRDKRVRGESSARTLEALSEMDRLIRRLPVSRTPAMDSAFRRIRAAMHIAYSGSFGWASLSELGSAASYAGLRAMAQQNLPLRRMVGAFRVNQGVDGEWVQVLEFRHGQGLDSLLHRHDLDDDYFDIENAAKRTDRALATGTHLANRVNGYAFIDRETRLWTIAALYQRWVNLARKQTQLSNRALQVLDLDRPTADRIFAALREEIATNRGVILADGPETGRRLNLVKFEEWSDQQAASMLISHIDRVSRRAILSTDLGDRIPLVQNHALLRTFFQFRAFSLAAWDRMLGRGVRSLDRPDTWVRMAYSTLAAGLVYSAKTWAESLGRPDEREYRAERLAWDRIAAASFARAGFSSLMPGFIDEGAFMFGGTDPIFGVRYSGLGGGLGINASPATTYAGDLYELVRDTAQAGRGVDEFDQSDARNAVGLLPFNRLVGFRNAMEHLIQQFPEPD